ncbi:MAG: hypothetical protein ABIP64_04455 [Burkholderiales bacterium]
MITEFELTASLQTFALQRSVDVEQLNAETMIKFMVDWFRFVPIENIDNATPADTLVYRYGGWSEGCATGFKYSLLRRVNLHDAEKSNMPTELLAGITLMFEPSRYVEITPAEIVLTDQGALSAFILLIENSPGFQLSASRTPMSVALESSATGR